MVPEYFLREVIRYKYEIPLTLHWIIPFASGTTNRVFFLNRSCTKENMVWRDQILNMASDVGQSTEQHNRAEDKPLTIGDKYFLTAMVSDQNIEAGRDKHSLSCGLWTPHQAPGCQMRLLTSSNALCWPVTVWCSDCVTVILLMLCSNENTSQYISYRLACNLHT